MKNNKKVTWYFENRADELNSALIYETISKIEKDSRLAEVYRRIAETERKHAERWKEKILSAEENVPLFRPSWRTLILIELAKRFGAGTVLPALQSMEKNGSQNYATSADSKDMSAEEQSHNRVLSLISSTVRGGFEGSTLAQLEGRHRTGGNALRAAVLGANDGMVSNLSLVMGVAGAALDNRTILITGLAGMLAGGISMALGEWLSVQSSRELFSHQLKIEEAEIENSPEEEAEELALIYEARGLQPDQARILADQILANPISGLQTLAREELGFDPDELGGSAWEAAGTSFILFSIGAIVPVIAFTFLSGFIAVITSIILSTIGLFVIGIVTSIFTGKSALYSGGRMVLFGLLAAALTFGIGRLVGVGLGG
jgi:VIT1/CCC1 family predicted Fe2+/Mn2+ transporter/rubrerythrin